MTEQEIEIAQLKADIESAHDALDFMGLPRTTHDSLLTLRGRLELIREWSGFDVIRQLKKAAGVSDARL